MTKAQRKHVPQDTGTTFLWWLVLCSFQVCNCLLWITAVALIWGEGEYQRGQLSRAGVFTFVCAFRSFFPRIDLERYVLWDVWPSAIVLGRFAATVAELSYAAEVSAALHLIGETLTTALDVPSPLREILVTAAGVLSHSLVPALAIAQCFCWHAVATLNHLSHAVEESIWMVTHAGVAVVLGAVAWAVGPTAARLQGVLGLASLALVAYVVFMARVDVPMYVARWRVDARARKRRMPVVHGLRDAARRRVHVRGWEEVWCAEAPWLTGYFTMAVWVSIALAFLPYALPEAALSA
eukprot:TRINITY_DN58082_c0_g1_i1.p1 TRINITY_DN58082_c0_g1~~TRINITY_DN58082_c0_g1_i1.p1  ORF type:complete len:295 (+),score=11.98 TRINITY_DN58082_c0_g1_i1:63-947(+)